MRAQTTFDFLLGIVVFISVVAFIFLFVPGILEPFSGVGGENPTVTDRIANTASAEMLGSAAQPRVLDRYCTVEFFAGNNPADCNFDGETLDERFNLDNIQNVNITLKGDLSGTGGGVPCWDGTDHEWTGTGEADCDTPLRIGDDRPTGGVETVTSQRVVSLDGHDLQMEVVIW